MFLKKFWCQLPEDGEIIVPKHVVAMEKDVRINNRTERLLLHVFSTVLNIVLPYPSSSTTETFLLTLLHTKSQASKHLNTTFVLGLNVN